MYLLFKLERQKSAIKLLDRDFGNVFFILLQLTEHIIRVFSVYALILLVNDIGTALAGRAGRRR
jgi:hypothetical protein